jgi:DNA adenine methylase
MTTYQGGKQRIGKKIHDIIQLVENNLSSKKLSYFEPFVGMAGVLKHFGEDDDRELYASDINIDLIMMWKALQKGWKPPKSCTRKKYETLKKSKKHSPERSFIGSVASWGGIFFHAFRLDYKKDKDFIMEGYRSLMKIKPLIKKVKFKHAVNYKEWDVKNFLIYCDPPYKDNNLGTKNSLFKTFNHEEFWDVMRKWSKNNIVIISESNAPKDFKKLWCTNSYNSNIYKTKKYSDCLFIHENDYKKLSIETIKEIKDI